MNHTIARLNATRLLGLIVMVAFFAATPGLAQQPPENPTASDPAAEKARREFADSVIVITREDIKAGKARAAKKLAELKQNPTENFDEIAMLETTDDMMQLGVGLMSWLTDQVTGDRAEASPNGSGQAEKGTRRSATVEGWTTGSKGTPKENKHFFPAVTYQHIVQMLVPDYLDSVPEHDRWGHPYQFAVNEDTSGFGIISIRSTGRDGRFEADDYNRGRNDAGDYDRDIVWTDGFLVRIPTRSQPATP